MKKFEATFTTANGQYIGQDYNTAEEATKAVEANGRGQVVKFHGQPNMPHCLPETVWSSCGLWTLTEKGWQQHSLFDGYGRAFEQSTPR